jgi:N-formylglutamate deformylase
MIDGRGLFLRIDPTGDPAPLFVDVSKSGTDYPKDFRTAVPFTALHDNVSMHVEDIFADAPRHGATFLYCCFAAAYVDVNRNEIDLDPAIVEGEWPVALEPTPRSLLGHGLIKTKSRYGEPVYDRKLTVAEIEGRLEQFHRPYHLEMKSIVEDLHARFGMVRQISGHCMSATGAPTHMDAGKPRADFCICDRNGVTSSRAFRDLVADTVRSFGYSVTINDPYPGNELIRRYGDPARRIDSLHFEINKKLYMDTATFKKTEGYARVKADVDRLLQVVAEDARQRAQSL